MEQIWAELYDGPGDGERILVLLHKPARVWYHHEVEGILYPYCYYQVMTYKTAGIAQGSQSIIQYKYNQHETNKA